MTATTEINLSLKTANTTHPVTLVSLLFHVLTSPMKTCSKAEVVRISGVREYNVNQIFLRKRINGRSSFGARPADKWREVSGVNITLFLTG